MINRARFNLYVETQLAPTLKPGDVVILDNLSSHKSAELSSHKSAEAAKVLKSIDARFLFLPLYSPDLSPIEMPFAKFKALIRKAAARSYDDLWKAAGATCGLYSSQECENFFTAAGYGAN